MSWGGLNPALTAWRTGINQRFPKRGTASDGGYADKVHGSTSQHQPDSDGTVDSFDCDVNFHGSADPDGNATEDRIAEALKADFEADRRSHLWIHQREIANEDVRSFAERAYAGASPHDHHIHFECEQAHEKDGSPWRFTHTDALLRELNGDDMTTKAEFLNWLQDKDVRKALALAVLAHDPGLDATGEVPAGGVKNYGSTFEANPTVAPAWSIGRAQIAADLGYQNRTRLDQIMVLLKELTGRDFTDEPAIASAVLAGLNPAVIAAAIPRELAGQVADELAARLKA